MKIKKAVGSGAALLVAATATLGMSVAPASADVTIACTSAPAPSISGSAGVVTAHYYHSCNSIAGVDNMYGDITIFNETTGLAEGRFVVAGTPQTTAAGTTTATIADLGHGYFYAEEDLTLIGSFSYGSVSGCARVSANEVDCSWFTAVHYY